jgi:hypothetical protein
MLSPRVVMLEKEKKEEQDWRKMQQTPKRTASPPEPMAP